MRTAASASSHLSQPLRSVLAKIRHVQARRDALRAELDVWSNFKLWEESCVPSYCHPNRLAALVAWLRLFAAAEVAQRHAPPGPVLDFGAATGELAHLLPASARYHFIEQDEAAATYLTQILIPLPPGPRDMG